MKLREILPADAEFDAHDADRDVGGVTADSRNVKRGDIFVAIAGNKADGARFIVPAIAAGAVAVLAEQPPAAPLLSGVGRQNLAKLHWRASSQVLAGQSRQTPYLLSFIEASIS